MQVVQCAKPALLINTAAEEGEQTEKLRVLLSPRPMLSLEDLDTFPSSTCEPSPAVQPAASWLPWCYVMFTSGSTGQPLGVRGTEEGILNRCSWMVKDGLIAQV